MVFFRLTYLYRPKYIFLSTVLVTLVFLMYQLFSVGQLGKELRKKRYHSQLQTSFREYEKADAIITHKTDSEKINKRIRGASMEDWKRYTPSNSGTFKCFNNREEIDFSLVNDNYCDCSDFSDEPSTSACSFGRFHCSHQSHTGPISIASYKVNDGICDCCDGSDEWEYLPLPLHTRLPAEKQAGIYQVPCIFRCLQ